ncbi:NHL repeat-containing protein [Candidatus Albibeggiatoa sp. nov. NOAA]|uniref:NHL repeat-containing protein n=1 Tax=Candidatus Albibeggiatoa sp. nov. NOAA TaxID=3162724 RepID=UPI00330347A9|nr:NHL repeat-containing protein [Thiotrichaceae bacterium]
MSSIKFLNHYGDIGSSAKVGSIPSSFTLNTPVGIASDHNDNIWVCDTGNNQIIIFDNKLKSIIDVITETIEKKTKESKKTSLFLPFHITPHPEEKKMYLTDMGNRRVVVFSYDNQDETKYATYEFSFGQPDDGINNPDKLRLDGSKYEPLEDPNGITLVKEYKSSQTNSEECKKSKEEKEECEKQFVIYVTDEFFHTEEEPLKNRCVKFDINGNFISQFKAITDEYGKCYPMKWPQGLSSDSEGSLYLANTGYYEVLKCESGVLDNYSTTLKDYFTTLEKSPNKDNRNNKKFLKNQRIVKSEMLQLESEHGSPFVHSFGNPKGSGYTNIIRGVNVINDLAFIPDQVSNRISVYDTKSNQLVCTIMFMIPMPSVAIDSQQNISSLSDWAYTQAENTLFISPYGICAGKEKDVYFITEPTVSCVLKIQITDLSSMFYGCLGKKVTPMLLAKVGSRRTNKSNNGVSSGQEGCSKEAHQKNIPDLQCSQFNVVTSVAGIKQDTPPTNISNPPKLSGYLPNNPFQLPWTGTNNSLNTQYCSIYDVWRKLFNQASSQAISGNLYNIGAGNWTIKAYKESADHPNVFTQKPQSFFSKHFVPLGNVGIAVYYPQTPMLGQICPGTPLVFITNFMFGFVSICQFDLNGQLVYYGLPFGLKGQCEFSLNGPQGITISPQGEIYIANSMSHCISKWRIWPTGLVTFIKTFGGDEIRNFMPTDVTIDKDNRIFACDQLNNKIYVFSAEGELLCKYGQTGYWKDDEEGAADNFQLPTSVCVDDDKLIVNDLVNRAIKIFTIKEDKLEFDSGISLFTKRKGQGGIWMPYLMYAEQGKIYVPDCAYNIVNVYEYKKSN